MSTFSNIEQQVCGILYKLFVELRKKTAVIYGSFTVGNIIKGDFSSVSFDSFSEEIVAGNAVIFRGFDNEIKPALPYTFFIVREQSLRNTKVFGYLLFAKKAEIY